MEKILVIDYGSQYNELIVRRCRDNGVYASLISYKDDVLSYIKNNDVKGIILSVDLLQLMKKMLHQLIKIYSI